MVLCYSGYHVVLWLNTFRQSTGNLGIIIIIIIIIIMTECLPDRTLRWFGHLERKENNAWST